MYDRVNNIFILQGNIEDSKRNRIKESLEKADKKYNLSSKEIHNIYFTKGFKAYPDIHRVNDLSKHLANISDEYLYEKFSEDIQKQYKHNLTSFIQIRQLYDDSIFQNGLEAFYKDSIKFPSDWMKPNRVSISFSHSYVFTSYNNLLITIKEKEETEKEEEKEKIRYEDLVKFKDLYNIFDKSGKPHYLVNDWQYFFKYSSILNFIVSLTQGIRGEYDKIIKESIIEIDNNDKNNSIDKLIKFYKNDFEIDGATYGISKEYFSRVEEAISTLEQFNNFYKNGQFSIVIGNNLSDIIKLIELHKKLTITVSGFLSFRLFPYFSDGHQEFFNLFAKIYMAINTPFDNKKPKKNDTILLLLDEPDNYFHPNWQKQSLDTLIDFLSKNYNFYNFHLIVTSHSPFIISDLPKENIIFLDRYDEQDNEVKNGNQKVGNCKNVSKDIELKTFGANIHTLLSDGFFMSDGLMGEFAKSKINEIKRFYELVKKCEKIITKSENVKNTIKNIYQGYEPNFRNIQNIIGEPFLQMIIKNYLDELEILFNGKKEFLKNEIKRLQDLEKNLDD